MNKDSVDNFQSVDEIEVSINGKKFTNYFFPIDQEPPKTAGSLIDFYRLWRNSNPKTKIPSRSDLPFEKLIGWHSNIRIVDLENSTPDVDKIIISGGTFDDYFGKHTMGTEINNSKSTSAEILAGYQKFFDYINDGYYGLVIGSPPNKDGLISRVAWLDLPLSNDGNNVTHLLSALKPVKGNAQYGSI